MNAFNYNSGESLEIDGAHIYYEITGVEDAPVLLFLHGGFGNIESFNPILPALEKEFNIIGIDSRGQGKSTLGDERLSYERIQKDVERILERLGIDTLSIVGFSDGGIVGYRLAVFTDLKIEKMATIGSRWHLKNVEPTRELFQSVTGESWRKKFPQTYDSYQKLNPKPDFDRLAESLVKMWLDEDPSGYPNEQIKSISFPLLITRGDNDHLISLNAVAEASKLVKDSALLNIPFAGHPAFSEQREIFTLSLNKFLSKE